MKSTIENILVIYTFCTKCQMTAIPREYKNQFPALRRFVLVPDGPVF